MFPKFIVELSAVMFWLLISPFVVKLEFVILILPVPVIVLSRVNAEFVIFIWELFNISPTLSVPLLRAIVPSFLI